MARWIHRIYFRDILESVLLDYVDENEEREDVERVGKELFERLKNNIALRNFNLKKFLDAKTIHQMDIAINSLYDYCDANSIWCSFSEDNPDKNDKECKNEAVT